MKAKKRGKKFAKKRSFKKASKKLVKKIAQDPETKRFVQEEKGLIRRTFNRLLMRLRLK